MNRLLAVCKYLEPSLPTWLLPLPPRSDFSSIDSHPFFRPASTAPPQRGVSIDVVFNSQVTTFVTGKVINLASDPVIGQVLERGERIDTLVEKTDTLKFHANQFQKQGTLLRRRLWWDNMKMKAIFGCVGLLVILLIVLVACGLARCW